MGASRIPAVDGFDTSNLTLSTDSTTNGVIITGTNLSDGLTVTATGSDANYNYTWSGSTFTSGSNTEANLTCSYTKKSVVPSTLNFGSPGGGGTEEISVTVTVGTSAPFTPSSKLTIGPVPSTK
jgi:hypothetical protein